MRLAIRVFAGAAILFTLAACDPPGKPKKEELAAADVTDFKTLYSENCSGCHGVDGKKGPGRILNDAVYLAVIPKDALKNVIVNTAAQEPLCLPGRIAKAVRSRLSKWMRWWMALKTGRSR